MKHNFNSTLASIFLTISFITLDIAQVYPQEHVSRSDSLAAQSLFQQQMMTEDAQRFRETVFSDVNLSASISSIARYLLGDLEEDTKPLPIKYMSSTLTAELGKALGGIDLSGVTIADGIVLIPYERYGQRYVIKIALRNNPAFTNMPGCEWPVLDKYAIKVLPADRKTHPEFRRAASGLALDISMDMREIKIKESGAEQTILLMPILRHGEEKTSAVAVNLSWIRDYYYLRHKNKPLQEWSGKYPEARIISGRESLANLAIWPIVDFDNPDRQILEWLARGGPRGPPSGRVSIAQFREKLAFPEEMKTQVMKHPEVMALIDGVDFYFPAPYFVGDMEALVKGETTAKGPDWFRTFTGLPSEWKGTPCNLCGSEDYEVKFIIGPSRFVRCRACGLEYDNPQAVIKQKDLDKYSSDIRDEKTKSHKALDRARQEAKIIVDGLKKLRPDLQKAPLLEIGSASGELLYVLREEYGWRNENLTGTDLSSRGVEFAGRKYGLNILNKELKAANFESGKFKVVIIYNTIEHINNPRELFEEVNRVLADDGVVFLGTVPNQSCLTSLIFPQGLLARNFPDGQHHYQFEPRTLIRSCETEGFEMMQMDGETRDPFLNRIKAAAAWLAFCCGIPLDETGDETAMLKRIENIVTDMRDRIVKLKGREYGFACSPSDFKSAKAFIDFWKREIYSSPFLGDDFDLWLRKRRVGEGRAAILGGKPVFKKRIQIIEPTRPSDERGVLKTISAIVKQSMYNFGFGYRKKFEEDLGRYLKLKDRKAIAVTSGTDALELLLIGAEVGKDGRDEVIVPSFTFHATIRAILRRGLKPVFADINPETLNIDPEKVENLVSDKTGAIMPVDIFGNPADYEKFREIASRHKLALLIDSAGSLGSTYNGTPIGNFGDGAAISFSFGKIAQAFGKGGVVIVNDKMLGALKKDRGGMLSSSMMPEINAVMAFDNMQSIERHRSNRQQAARIYAHRLNSIPGLAFQRLTHGATSTYVHFPIIVDEEKFGLNRDQLKWALAAEGIQTKEYFPAQHRDFTNYRKGDLGNTERISDSVLCLPVWSDMDRGTAFRVAEAVRKIYRNRDEIAEVFRRREEALNNFSKLGAGPFTIERDLLFRRFYLLKAMMEGKVLAPPQIEIHPSESCTHNCKSCIGKLRHDAKPMRSVIMTPEEILKLLRDVSEYNSDIQDEAMRVRLILFSGRRGEPLVSPATLVGMKEALARGLETALVTNGLLLDGKARETVVNAKYAYISLYGGSAKSYSAVTGTPETYFERVIDNIRELARLKRERGTKVEIGVGYLIQPENFPEILSITELAKSLGADYIRFRADMNPGERVLTPDEWSLCYRYLREAQEKFSDSNFKVISMYTEEDARSLAKRNFERCSAHPLIAVVGPNLNVYPCAHRSGPRDGSFGSLKRSTLKEIWTGSRKRRFIRRLTPSENCPICPPQANRVNALLEFLSNESSIDPTFADWLEGWVKHISSHPTRTLGAKEDRKSTSGVADKGRGLFKMADLPKGTKTSAAETKKDPAQFEADSVVASIITLARKAKRENQKLIVGLETDDWIPGFKEPHSLQRSAINPLIREIDSIGETLRSIGLNNVEIIHKKSSDLADSLLRAANDTNTKLSNVVVLASKSTIDSSGFDSLRSTGGERRAFLAAIDPTELEKYYSEHSGSVAQLNIKIIEMLSIALELAVGKEPPNLPIVFYYDKINRIIIFMPKAEPIDCERLKAIYHAQKIALQAA